MTRFISGTVKNVSRRDNTSSGNPRWGMVVGLNYWTNADDAAVSYEIDHTLVDKHVVLELDEDDKIIGIRKDG